MNKFGHAGCRGCSCAQFETPQLLSDDESPRHIDCESCAYFNRDWTVMSVQHTFGGSSSTRVRSGVAADRIAHDLALHIIETGMKEKTPFDLGRFLDHVRQLCTVHNIDQALLSEKIDKLSLQALDEMRLIEGGGRPRVRGRKRSIELHTCADES